MARLQDKVVIITGGAGGIGKGMALAAAKEGAKIVLVDLNPEAGAAALKEVQEFSPESSFIQFDLTEHDKLKGMVEDVVAKYGRLDGLINNAHVSRQVPYMETTDDVMALSFNTGFYPTHYLMQASIPHLEKTKGSIINFASAAGIKGHATQGSYAAAKEAIRGLSRVVANEVAPLGINVNIIAPVAKTEGVAKWAEAQPEYYERVRAGIPLGRFGDPATDIGPVAVFLLSDDSNYMTGQTLSVDGGSLMLY
jgi:NAD(P)-dependent dehydrogenase (short-subunit alcohol dehydrogenase family)